MHKSSSVLLLSIVLALGFASPSLASIPGVPIAGKYYVTAAAQKSVPAWKSKLASRVVRFATWVDKRLPGYRAAEGNDINGLAIASLCCGIGGFVLLPILSSIAAIILGMMALSRIRETGQIGRGLAIAGIIMGAVGLLIYGLYLAILLAAWL